MLRAFILSFLWSCGLLYFLGGVMSKDERKQTMKIAALYDIHGNVPALEAVLSEIEREGVDMIVVGGDMVPGPMPRDVLVVLLSLGDRVSWIRGNCEREVVEAFDGGTLKAYPNNPVRYFSVRQSIVNRFVLRECCSCDPFPYKG